MRYRPTQFPINQSLNDSVLITCKRNFSSDLTFRKQFSVRCLRSETCSSVTLGWVCSSILLLFCFIVYYLLPYLLYLCWALFLYIYLICSLIIFVFIVFFFVVFFIEAAFAAVVAVFRKNRPLCHLHHCRVSHRLIEIN